MYLCLGETREPRNINGSKHDLTLVSYLSRLVPPALYAPFLNPKPKLSYTWKPRVYFRLEQRNVFFPFLPSSLFFSSYKTFVRFSENTLFLKRKSKRGVVFFKPKIRSMTLCEKNSEKQVESIS